MSTKEEILNLYRGPYNFDTIYQWATSFLKRDLSGEDVEGFVNAVMEIATPLAPNVDLSKTIDISRSGGDKSQTINVGTIASFVLAASGLVVGKQSTRGYTGVLGSRDLLAQLGIEVPRENVDPKRIEGLLEKESLAFYFHPSFNNHFANHVRFFNELKEKNLSFVTPWHLLFWVYNPLPLAHRIYGMSTDRYLREVAQTFQMQGINRGWVVYGVGDIDEVSVTGPTKVVEFTDSELTESLLTPHDFGVAQASPESIKVNDADEAVQKATAVLNGEETGPLRDLVAINAGAGLYVSGVTESLEEGTKSAINLLSSGQAQRKYEDYRTAASAD